ncbi:MAG: flagellar hook-basal body complex protein [Bacteroidaceae bacterium]|nr:flagellar hook-basal body complex protein [Bacteroidaceae bacterium]
MMRSLWSAASGMKGQQTAVDTIANNLANVNTVSFKTQNTQFKSLLYQTLQNQSSNSAGNTKPTNIQVGLGTRVASINTSFAQGAPQANDSKTALYIAGEGFFAFRGLDGETHYTRNGNFGWSLNAARQRVLATTDGNPILNRNGTEIILPDAASGDSVGFSAEGELTYRDNTGNTVATGMFVALYQFPNAVGLEKIGSSNYDATLSSGEAIPEWSTNGIIPSEISQGYLEMSNVNVADEMVNLIVAQRAYEMNSKAITTSDSMLETANGLKR